MGKSELFAALRHEKAGRIPWVPFAGVHAGKLKGYTAMEVLTDGDKLYESLIEVNKLYKPDGMPVVFDLQIEAEILGCELKWAQDNPPSVKSHPCAGEKYIPCMCKMPDETSGRIPLVVDVTRRLKKEIGAETALFGLVCGPFTLASHLRGSDIFMDMVTDPKYVTALVEYCGQVAIKMSEIYLEAGADIIAVVDPLVSQISPKHFTSILSGTFTAVFDYIRGKNALSSFFVCGNASRQIEVMCMTNPDGISVDENVDMVKAKAVTDRYNITLGGNIPLTTTMLHGNQNDNMKAVIDLMDSLSHDNLIISPGCDMPYATPIENTIAVAQAVLDPDTVRGIIANYESVGLENIPIDIPDYAGLDRALVELFTLDPEQCAACTYMVNLVADSYADIKDFADYKVYKYTVKEDIARTAKMGIKNLPTMCVNGEQKWISLIPSKEEFVMTVKQAYQALKK